jgi:hypothetical protein
MEGSVYGNVHKVFTKSFGIKNHDDTSPRQDFYEQVWARELHKALAVLHNEYGYRRLNGADLYRTTYDLTYSAIIRDIALMIVNPSSDIA